MVRGDGDVNGKSTAEEAMRNRTWRRVDNE
jgi:hypothetical protein